MSEREDYAELDHYVGTLDDKEHKVEVINVKKLEYKVPPKKSKHKTDRPASLFWILIFILLFFVCLAMLYVSIILAKWMT